MDRVSDEKNYEHNGYKIIVDFIENGEVYYRKFKQDEYVGAYRMVESDFKQELENNKLSW